MIPIMPEDLQAEQALISCCFVDHRDSIGRAIEHGVAPDDFFNPACRIVYEKLCELYHRDIPISVQVVATELTMAGRLEAIGSYASLMEMSSSAFSTLQLTYWIKLVLTLSTQRKVILSTMRITERALTPNVDSVELASFATRDLAEATKTKQSEQASSAAGAAKNAVEVIAKMLSSNGEMTGVASGFKHLDQLTWGFQRKEVIILAARPSMGKTALALNIAEAGTMPVTRTPPVPTMFFSLEMSADSLATRIICARAKIGLAHLRSGVLKPGGIEWGRVKQAADELSRAPLFLDDTSSLTVDALCARARRVHQKQKLGLIIIDYLQLLAPNDPKTPREQQVAEASRALKALAKELDLPIIVLSQLNRSSERENRTPKLADLRESGSIEQDADVVLILARPPDNGDGQTADVAGDSVELFVAKQRNGPVGPIMLRFLRNITRFETMEGY